MLSMMVSAFQGPSQAALEAAEMRQVKENLYYIAGEGPGNRDAFSGGNVGVYVGEDGVTIVDTKLPGWGAPILERIRTVTDKPVVAIINTHTHGDHVGSNDFFPETVTIVAHQNTKANMERMDAFQGDGAKFLPARTYGDRLSLGTGQDRIDLYHFGPGHTDGDTFIVFPALGVVHTGDMFAWKDAPYLDRGNGGSGVSFPDTLAKAIAAIGNVDTVIPGHIPVTSWSDFEEYQRFNADLLAAAREGLAAGQSAEETAAGLDLSGTYPDYNSERIEAAIVAIYDELQ
jgi:glyoxylase-like metal-dependent hydrolase (beta-lactamase superfamily II)